MLAPMYSSRGCKHEYFFEFKGEKYRVHTVVKLTDEARNYLGAWRHEVVLKEVFYDKVLDRTLYKYEFKSIAYNVGIINKSTDRLPDEMIEEIVVPASADYASREILGTSSPVYKTEAATKHNKKDWEIPEVRKAWIIYILVFIGVSIFADWYVQLILRFLASLYFWSYRKAHIDAYTTFTHDEDDEIIKAKYYALYGIKSQKNDKKIDDEKLKEENQCEKI